MSSFHLFWPLSQEVCFKVKTASEVGRRYFRKFFKKDCFRVRSRWLLGAGNSDPGRSLILEIAGDASINLKWRNSYPRRMRTWSCASRWRGREGGKSLAFCSSQILMAHRVVLESSSSFLRIFFLNKNFQAGIGRWEPGPGSDGRGRTCSTSLQVGLSFWNSWWWQFNLQWHDSLPSLNFLVWKIKWGHCSGAGHPLIVSTLGRCYYYPLNSLVAARFSIVG